MPSCKENQYSPASKYIHAVQKIVRKVAQESASNVLSNVAQDKLAKVQRYGHKTSQFQGSRITSNRLKNALQIG